MTHETDAPQLAVELVERVLAAELVRMRAGTIGGDFERERAARLAVKVVRALGAEERVEYGIRNIDGQMVGWGDRVSADLYLLRQGTRGASLIARTVVTFPAIVGEWQEVE